VRSYSHGDDHFFSVPLPQSWILYTVCAPVVSVLLLWDFRHRSFHLVTGPTPSVNSFVSPSQRSSPTPPLIVVEFPFQPRLPHALAPSFPMSLSSPPCPPVWAYDECVFQCVLFFHPFVSPSDLAVWLSGKASHSAGTTSSISGR